MDISTIFLQQPHWLVKILIAIVLGALLPKVGQMLIRLGNRSKTSHLLGTWTKYHVSYNKEKKPEIFKTTWIIKRGFFTPYKVTYKYPNETFLYHGSMEIERDQLIFVLKASPHEETVVYRTTYPLPSPDSNSTEPLSLSGLWLSYAHDGSITSGATIMYKSRPEDLAPEKASEQIQAKLEQLETSFLVREDYPSIKLNL